MKKYSLAYEDARQILLDLTTAVEAEPLPLAQCGGRILAETLRAKRDIPLFDHSPYDGYAFCSSDTRGASKEQPVTLQIVEEVPAGAVPTRICEPGMAVKILTGAPIPAGADAVVMYEKTQFTEDEVTLFEEVRAGENIVFAGRVIKAGAVIAEAGCHIDTQVMEALALQGIAEPMVYRIPKIGIISTGNELVELGQELLPGKLYNSNRYALTGAVQALGCEPVYLGIAKDTWQEIGTLMEAGLAACDAVISTGGVSVGDYDMTPKAMAQIGAEILFRGVNLKPGMACCYGIKDGKILCGLSGKPSAARNNFNRIASFLLKKLTGSKELLL